MPLAVLLFCLLLLLVVFVAPLSVVRGVPEFVGVNLSPRLSPNPELYKLKSNPPPPPSASPPFRRNSSNASGEEYLHSRGLSPPSTSLYFRLFAVSKHAWCVSSSLWIAHTAHSGLLRARTAIRYGGQEPQHPCTSPRCLLLLPSLLHTVCIRGCCCRRHCSSFPSYSTLYTRSALRMHTRTLYLCPGCEIVLPQSGSESACI